MSSKRGRKPQIKAAASNRGSSLKSSGVSAGFSTVRKQRKQSWADMCEEDRRLVSSLAADLGIESLENQFDCLANEIDVDSDTGIIAARDGNCENITNLNSNIAEHVDDDEVVGIATDDENSGSSEGSESGSRSKTNIIPETQNTIDASDGRKSVLIKPWAEVTKENRYPSHGLTLDFLAPTVINGVPVAKMIPAEVQKELYSWKNGLILFAVGKDLSMNSVKQFMIRNWNFVSLPSLYYHNDGYFVVRFKDDADREQVLANGPYTILSAPMFLKKWTPGFTMKDDLLRTMPIWVTFPSLPLHLWGQESLSRVASTLGKPITTDECTAKKLRISYARILVEIDITQERKKIISIEDIDGTVKQQSVEYEWLPKFCNKCQKIGHSCEAIQKTQGGKMKEVWVPKTKGTEESVVENRPASNTIDLIKELEKSTKAVEIPLPDKVMEKTIPEKETPKDPDLRKGSSGKFNRNSVGKLTVTRVMDNGKTKGKDDLGKRQKKANLDADYIYQKKVQRGRGAVKADAKVP